MFHASYSIFHHSYFIFQIPYLYLIFIFYILYFLDLLRNPCFVAAKRLIFHIPRNPMEAPARLQAPYIHMPARLMWMMDCTTSTTQTSTTPDIHHTMGKIGHPPHQTSTTPDIHHTVCKIGHPPHQTSTTPDIHHTRHPPHQTSTTL